VVPRFGPTSGGNLVTILGQHFGTREQAASKEANPNIPSSTSYKVQRRVSLGGSECVSTVLVSDSEIVCEAPQGIGGGAAMVELLDDDVSRHSDAPLRRTQEDQPQPIRDGDTEVWGQAPSFSRRASLYLPDTLFQVRCSLENDIACLEGTLAYEESQHQAQAAETDEAYSVTVPPYGAGEAIQHRWRRAGALPSELGYSQATLMLGGVMIPAAATDRKQGFVALSPSPAFPGTLMAPAASAQRLDLYLSRGVAALIMLQGRLFAGGSFFDAYREHGGGVRGASWRSQMSHFRRSPGAVNVSVGGIVSFDGHQVSSLGLGLDGEVLALAVFDGKIIAGGSFTIAHQFSEDEQQALRTGSVAQWDQVQQLWSRLPGLPATGLPGVVHAFAAGKRHLFVGGNLEMNHHLAAAPPPADKLGNRGPQIRGVAAYDAVSGQWSALGAGIQNGFVYALLLGPLEIWTSAHEGTTRHQHDASLDDPPGELGAEEALLFAGGDFRMAGGHKAAGIAMWHRQEQAWYPLGQLDGAVHALAAMEGWLYAGGDFTVAGGSRDGSSVASDHVARFRHGIWHPVVGGVGGPVYSLLTVAGCVYVGGRFDRVCVAEEHAQALVEQGILPAGTRRHARCTDDTTPMLHLPTANAARFCNHAKDSSAWSSNMTNISAFDQWEPLVQAPEFQLGTVRAMAAVPAALQL